MPRTAIRPGYTQSQDEIYAIGGNGSDQRVLSHLQVYNFNIKEWLDMPIQELSVFSEQSAVYLPAYQSIFLAGGVKPYKNDLLLIDDIRLIDKGNLKVDSLGQLPFPAKNLGLAVQDKRVFMFGGSTEVKKVKSRWQYEFSNKLMVYNLENGHLHVYPDMPEAKNTQGGIIGKYLYLLGGYNGKSTRSVWRFDLLNETWESLRPLKKPFSAYALAQYNEYFILVAAYGQENKLMVYNTETEKSHLFKTNLSARFTGASIIRDELHVYGGFNRGATATGTHFKLPLGTLLKAVQRLD